MSRADDRRFKEIEDSISAGNKTFGLFLLGALIWWIGNLFPYNLSERANKSLDIRLSELSERAARAESSCEGAIAQYANVRADALIPELAGTDQTSRCLALIGRPARALTFATVAAPRSQSGAFQDAELKARQRELSEQIKRELSGLRLGQSLTHVYKEIDEAAKNNNACNLSDWRDNHFKKCTEYRKALSDYVDDWSKQGSLDVAGLKINNIHPRWHPLVLSLILAIGALWIGLKRLRIYSLLDQYIVGQEAQAAAAANAALPNASTLASLASPPILLALPWWMGPVPKWSYASGRTLEGWLVSASEYKRAIANAAFNITVLLAMFISGLFVQRVLSKYAECDTAPRRFVQPACAAMSSNAKDLADFGSRSFGLWGEVFIDLFLITLLVIAAVGALWFVVQPGRAVAQGKALHRRAVVRSGASLAGILALALVAPVLLSPASIFTPLQRLRVVRRPRFRREIRYATRPDPSGWYVRDKSTRRKIGHFVKPPFDRQRAVKRGPARLARAAEIIAGRIKGAGKLRRSTVLVKLPDDMLPALRRPATGATNPTQTGGQVPEPRLNTRFYSEGVEAAALENWRANRKDRAIAILRIGLTYAEGQSPLNVRLYDLLAIMLLRSGRQQEIASLRPAIERERDLISRRLARLDRDVNVRLPEKRQSASEITRQVRVSAEKRSGKLQARKMARERPKLETQRELLNKRLTVWADADSKWTKKWREPSRKWNGVDI